jgi:hypothetical protein
MGRCGHAHAMRACVVCFSCIPEPNEGNRLSLGSCAARVSPANPRSYPALHEHGLRPCLTHAADSHGPVWWPGRGGAGPVEAGPGVHRHPGQVSGAAGGGTSPRLHAQTPVRAVYGSRRKPAHSWAGSGWSPGEEAGPAGRVPVGAASWDRVAGAEWEGCGKEAWGSVGAGGGVEEQLAALDSEMAALHSSLKRAARHFA